MVSNSANTFINNRIDVVSPLYVCSNTLAGFVFAENEAQGWGIWHKSNDTALNLMILGFSPHDAHTHTSWFAWILPTIKTSEFTVLQIVGLDAAVVCADRYILGIALTRVLAS